MKRNNIDLNKSCEKAIEDEEQEASEDEEQENENISFEPFIGQCFLSEEEAYLFYHKYAKQYGFSICKARFDKNKDGEIKRRDFVYHREGLQLSKMVDPVLKQRNTPSTRCDCKAHMRVTLKKSFEIFPEQWHVTEFIVTHNHELFSQEEINAYDMPLGMLVGIDNHGRTILFGCAILRNETKNTFSWLMRTFVSLMNKPPKSILTDQDPWMTQAIAEEMPLTKLAFCIWHITSKFSNWHSWVPAYLREHFFVGMTTTGRSESFNAFIKRFVDLAIEDIVQNQLQARMLEKYRGVSLRTLSPLEEQAQKVLTPFSFKKIQEHFERATHYTIHTNSVGGFVVQHYAQGDTQNKIIFDQERVVDVVSETQGESNIFEDANLAGPVYCPPKSKTKGRPKSKRSKGGKECSSYFYYKPHKSLKKINVFNDLIACMKNAIQITINNVNSKPYDDVDNKGLPPLKARYADIVKRNWDALASMPGGSEAAEHPIQWWLELAIRKDPKGGDSYTIMTSSDDGDE
ncbi:protein FAR1-RELATED SEQUENCE 11-like [Apium graveolens]|uniref:protein FAR1-RELATED SEQUENCE 11-like n=1 Tax=Apium graveolens TaxID=4045 RepID=UPI003D7A5ECB